jgi:hypothetical protein
MQKIGDSIREAQHLDLLNHGCDEANERTVKALNRAIECMTEGDSERALGAIGMAKDYAEDYRTMSNFDCCEDGWIEKFLALELHHGSYWSKGD